MIATHKRVVTLGTRPSKLARWQTDWVRQKLESAWPETQFRVQTLVTEGDRSLDRPLPEIGGKGVFTAELENALRSGEIDLAVHSLKDMPVEASPGLCLAAVSRREDARDGIISASGWDLASLPQGARVGTSSLRRSAQLLAARPDLKLLSLRGNVDTRLRKAAAGGEYDAIVLAAAGLLRLGLEGAITAYLAFEVMLPSPGQGALAIQCRVEDVPLQWLLEAVNDSQTADATRAERAFLSALNAGCSAPVAAYAEFKNEILTMNGMVAALDGSRMIRVSGSGQDAAWLGQQLAQDALEQGAGELLA